MKDINGNEIGLNTTWLIRMKEEKLLTGLSRDDLIEKLERDCGIRCPLHTKKDVVINLILEAKYGRET